LTLYLDLKNKSLFYAVNGMMIGKEPKKIKDVLVKNIWVGFSLNNTTTKVEIVGEEFFS